MIEYVNVIVCLVSCLSAHLISRNHNSDNLHPIREIKGKVHPKNMLVSDVRYDKIGKNAVDRFSISPLVLKIFAFKMEELLIWKQPF